MKPDVVIWPENSTDIDPYKDAETRGDIEEAVKAVNVPILVGAVTRGARPERAADHRHRLGPGQRPRAAVREAAPGAVR